jgi:hypothetical protein
MPPAPPIIAIVLKPLLVNAASLPPQAIRGQAPKRHQPQPSNTHGEGSGQYSFT